MSYFLQKIFFAQPLYYERFCSQGKSSYLSVVNSYQVCNFVMLKIIYIYSIYIARVNAFFPQCFVVWPWGYKRISGENHTFHSLGGSISIIVLIVPIC